MTTPARTAFDLGRRARFETAIIRVDALANATNLKPDEVERLAADHRGARGIVQLRRVVELMDGGAESPQETRTRLLLIAAGSRGRERKSSSSTTTANSSAVSTWGGTNGRLASNTTVRNIGTTLNSTLVTSIDSPTWLRKAG